MAIWWTSRRDSLIEGGDFSFIQVAHLGIQDLNEYHVFNNILRTGSLSRITSHFFPLYLLYSISECLPKLGFQNKFTSIANWKWSRMATRSGVGKDSGTVSHITRNTGGQITMAPYICSLLMVSIPEAPGLLLDSYFPTSALLIISPLLLMSSYHLHLNIPARAWISVQTARPWLGQSFIV